MNLIEGLEGIMFDLDGTLVRTDKGFYHTHLRKTLDYFGFDCDEELSKVLWFDENRDIILRNMGLNPKEIWPLYIDTEDGDLIRKNISIYSKEDQEFLDALNYFGISRALVTGASKQAADIKIDLFGEDRFDVCLSSHTLGTSKAEAMNVCIDHMGINRYNTIYVGNSDGDIRECRKIGVPVVIIDRGEYPTKETPDYKINTISELMSL